MALFGFEKDVDGYVRLVQNEPRKLVESLGLIAAAVSVTPVLWIDQAEEVFSLGKSREEENQRVKYFEFLSLFGQSKFPLKLIVAFRKDYFGDFWPAIQKKSRQELRIEWFLLENLSDYDLVRAIERPTIPEEAPGYGKPHYRFKFEKDLPETIVRDLRATAEASGLVGGDLPILQAICETLYRESEDRGKPDKEWIITFKDYLKLGKIQTQLDDYVDRFLIEFCQIQQIPIDQQASKILLWKDALTPLAKTQRDNSITSDLKTMKELMDVKPIPDDNFGPLLKFLADDKQGVLRNESIRPLGAEHPQEGYSLRHDAVGLVLKRWRDARNSNRSAEQSIDFTTRAFMWGSLLFSVVFAVAAVRLYEETGTFLIMLMVFDSVMFAVGSFTIYYQTKRVPRAFRPFYFTSLAHSSLAHAVNRLFLFRGSSTTLGRTAAGSRGKSSLPPVRPYLTRSTQDARQNSGIRATDR